MLQLHWGSIKCRRVPLAYGQSSLQACDRVLWWHGDRWSVCFWLIVAATVAVFIQHTCDGLHSADPWQWWEPPGKRSGPPWSLGSRRPSSKQSCDAQAQVHRALSVIPINHICLLFLKLRHHQRKYEISRLYDRHLLIFFTCFSN